MQGTTRQNWHGLSVDHAGALALATPREALGHPGNTMGGILDEDDDLTHEIRSFTELLSEIDVKDLTREERAALRRLYDLLVKVQREAAN
jgi:hypothetical protein